jgi:predicted MFS family arabinose efflux permease
LFFAATALTGIGFGLAMLGVLCSLLALAAPTARGALVAAIYIVAYLANAVPAVVAGYLVTRIGLHDSALWYGGASGVLVLAGLAGTLFVRHLSRADASAGTDISKRRRGRRFT